MKLGKWSVIKDNYLNMLIGSTPVKTSETFKTELFKKGKKTFVLVEDKWSCEWGAAGEDFIKEFIIENCSRKSSKKKLLDALKIEPFIEYKVFTTWFNEYGNIYDELWFFDIGEEYIPVYVKNINGSYCYAYNRSNMKNDYDEGEHIDYYTRDDILDFVKTEKQKKAISSLFH